MVEQSASGTAPETGAPPPELGPTVEMTAG